MRTAAFPAAAGAVQHRRITAAVQQHQGLLAAGVVLADQIDQLRGDRLLIQQLPTMAGFDRLQIQQPHLG